MLTLLLTKILASMVALLACRGGVRTFAAACGWRTSLACFVGTLAAVPGCMKMLAHFLLAAFVVAVGVLSDEGFENLQNVLLLGTRQAAGLLEYSPEPACRAFAALRAVGWRV